ncbi:MAG: DUF455 family protein [Burkholderiaceae bacterium]
MNPRRLALQVLCIADPATKARAAIESHAAFDANALDVHEQFQVKRALPGRPERPVLVAPKDVPMRSPFTLEGRAALLHAVAHIEFNAIKQSPCSISSRIARCAAVAS